MSDYLWDKSGEPDAEVERLETLLGELRFEPERKLELPPEMIVPARSRPYPALAVAAALVLMILAGVWLAVVKRHSSTSSDLQVVENPTETATPKVIEMSPVPPLRVNDLATSGRSESENKLNDDNGRAAPRPPDRVVPASLRRPSARRPYQSGLKRRGEVEPPEMLEAKRAKEQLMLALHVVSAKINLAQRKAPGITDLSPGGSY